MQESALRARIEELEAELTAHRRAAMLIFLEYAKHRPAERVHLIALLRELLPVMAPPAAAIGRLLIDELESAGRGPASSPR